MVGILSFGPAVNIIYMYIISTSNYMISKHVIAHCMIVFHTVSYENDAIQISYQHDTTILSWHWFEVNMNLIWRLFGIYLKRILFDIYMMWSCCIYYIWLTHDIWYDFIWWDMISYFPCLLRSLYSVKCGSYFEVHFSCQLGMVSVHVGLYKLEYFERLYIVQTREIRPANTCWLHML